MGAFVTAISGFAGVHEIPLDISPDRVESPLRVSLKQIGTMEPRTIYDVKSSTWTIGCEGLDRDFANFWEYAEFLEPLGIRKIRQRIGKYAPNLRIRQGEQGCPSEWRTSFAMRNMVADADGVTFMNVPAYDSPCVLTERSVVMDLPKPTHPVDAVFGRTRDEIRQKVEAWSRSRVRRLTVRR